MEDIVARLDQIVRETWKHAGIGTGHADPENLSLDILKLASLNVQVGNLLADAIREADSMETEHKYNFEQSKLMYMETPTEAGKKISATAAESLARVDTFESAKNLDRMNHAVTVLKLKRADVDAVIDAARSRLSLIKNDIRTETQAPRT